MRTRLPGHLRPAFLGLLLLFVPEIGQALPPQHTPRPDARPEIAARGVADATPPAAGTRALHRSIRPSARPEQRAPAPPTADRLVAAARLSGEVAYVVADARTGEFLEARNPGLGQPPASVAKTITSLYALDRLGPGYRYTTRLLATGPIRDGRLHGDLILQGAGDPTLDTRELAALAADLKAAGLREITGAFRVDAKALPAIQEIDPGQPDHAGYNPAISGLNLNFNRVHFGWERDEDGYDITLDARAGRLRPRVSTSQMRVVERRAPVYTYQKGGGTDEWTVARWALGKGGSRWLPVRDPAAYAGEVFQSLARSRGIVLPDAEPAERHAEGTVLADHASAPLREVLRGMLKYSTNLTAEAVGLTASAADGDRPATLEASARRMSRWLNGTLDRGTASFVDHSGLGGQSRIAPAVMVRALVRTGAGGPLADILKTIPGYDVRGRAAKDSALTIHAKTGTLNFVSGLAGFVTAPGRRDLVFAMFMADTERRAAIPPENRERPPGGRAWLARARRLQGGLIARWSALYGKDRLRAGRVGPAETSRGG